MRTNVNEIKAQLMQCIESANDDPVLLQRILDKVKDAMNESCHNPMIYYEKVGKNIKRDSNIIVPIVCDDMFEYVTVSDDGEKRMSVGDFICERLDVEEEVAKAIKTNFYFGISLLEQSEDHDYSNSIFSEIQKELSNFKLRESVREFLSNGDFPVIVTTFGFPIIENTLSHIKYEDKWFRPRYRNDIPFVRDEKSRVVYHIFGGDECGSWVYNEQTMLTFVHALHSVDYGAKNLSNYLKGIGNNDTKRPLVLGSSLPDWLFRFFIYPMFEDKLSKSYGYWLSLSEIETGLDMFLRRNKYKGLTNLSKSNQVDSILAEATLVRDDQNVDGNDNVDTKKRLIFISYKRENGKTPEVVKRIIQLFDLRQYEIWIDSNEVSDAGNPYWANIKKAIKKCHTFIPLITKKYLDEYQEAPDIDLLSKDPITDAIGEKANDMECIWDLKPVAREAYYAISYKKNSYPIIVMDEKNNIDGGAIEKIYTNYRNGKDNRRLPTGIFGENGAKTYPIYDDNNPLFFDIPNKD